MVLFYSKATTLNPSFACAWLLFGNTFAVCGEHDQAIASYKTAMRLYKASYMPLLCLGQEMIAIAQFEDAKKYLKIANSLCDNDPLIFNEYGTIAFQNKKYADARRYLERAEELLNIQMEPAVIELVHNNFAHALRCLRFVIFQLSFVMRILVDMISCFTVNTIKHWNTSRNA